MRDLMRINAELHGKPWLISPEWHRRMSAIAESALDGRMQVPAELYADSSEPEHGLNVQDGVAIIHVAGPIMPKVGMMEAMCGARSLADLSDDLTAAEMSNEVDGVLICMDSPGGHTTLVPEVARQIANFPKPLVTYVEGDCASAAYYLACSQTIYALGSGTVGSIGVYLHVYDDSKQWEMHGLRSILVSTGEYKGMLMPGQPVSEKQLAFLRDEVVQPTADKFFSWVAQHRPDVTSELMDGRFWDGERAMQLGLIDAIGSMDDAYAELKAMISMAGD